MEHVNFWNAHVDESAFDHYPNGFAAPSVDCTYDDFSGASSYAASAAPSDDYYSQSRQHQSVQYSARPVKAARRESAQSMPVSQSHSADSGFYSTITPSVDMADFLQPAYANGHDFNQDFVNEISRPSSPSPASESDGSMESTPSARNHPLYNATPKDDGLYYCPFAERGEDCGHEPKQLKCEYDKYIDSHLKPFRCRSPKCSDLQFSSTACLLRHEREAHEMHGHAESLCEYPPCNRSLPGNGFRRSYNCKDHMTRCHGWIDRSPVEKKKGRSAAASNGVVKKKVTKVPTKKQQIQYLREEFHKKKEEIEHLSHTLTYDGPLFAIALTQMNNEMQTLKSIQQELSRLTGKHVG